MRVIKRINNNTAICEDNNGNELITIGKRIGFPKTPYDLSDLSKIDMTFYRVDSQTLSMLESIPEDIIEVSSRIVLDAQKELTGSLNPNIVFGLADHINFAIMRNKKYKNVNFSLSYDIKHLYPKEYQVGKKALKTIKKELLEELPPSEAISIALHFINSYEVGPINATDDNKKVIIGKIIKIIEDEFSISLNKEDLTYNRFIIHLRYYLSRLVNSNQISDGSGEKMLMTFAKENRKIFSCAKDIVILVDQTLHTSSTNDELFYLMIYVNRLVTKKVSGDEKHE